MTRATRSWVSQELNPYGLKDATAGKGTFPKMKSDRGDKAEAPESALFDMLANINDHMKVIRSNLASNPVVVAATSVCDVMRYRDPASEEDMRYYFEAYVEAETHTGEMFCWSLDVILTSLGWKFQRDIAKQTSDGAYSVREFEDFAFGDLMI